MKCVYSNLVGIIIEKNGTASKRNKRRKNESDWSVHDVCGE